MERVQQYEISSHLEIKRVTSFAKSTKGKYIRLGESIKEAATQGLSSVNWPEEDEIFVEVVSKILKEKGYYFLYIRGSDGNYLNISW